MKNRREKPCGGFAERFIPHEAPVGNTVFFTYHFVYFFFSSFFIFLSAFFSFGVLAGAFLDAFLLSWPLLMIFAPYPSGAMRVRDNYYTTWAPFFPKKTDPSAYLPYLEESPLDFIPAQAGEGLRRTCPHDRHVGMKVEDIDPADLAPRY